MPHPTGWHPGGDQPHVRVRMSSPSSTFHSLSIVIGIPSRSSSSLNCTSFCARISRAPSPRELSFPCVQKLVRFPFGGSLAILAIGFASMPSAFVTRLRPLFPISDCRVLHFFRQRLSASLARLEDKHVLVSAIRAVDKLGFAVVAGYPTASEAHGKLGSLLGRRLRRRWRSGGLRGARGRLGSARSRCRAAGSRRQGCRVDPLEARFAERALVG